MAGNSSRTLTEKLGIKSDSVVLVINCPQPYSQFVPDRKYSTDIASHPSFECIHMFTKSTVELQDLFPKLKEKLSFTGALWVSWPKAAAKVQTDVNENVVREIGLDNGLVDVKVSAVDEVWSGLKFVYRLQDRK